MSDAPLEPEKDAVSLSASEIGTAVERERQHSLASLASVSKPNSNPTDFKRKPTVLKRRAYKNINDFIRVQILFKDGTRFQLTVDVNNKIEYLARQIEAEAALQAIGSQISPDNNDGKRLRISDVLKEDAIQKTIDVYQLYDAGNLPLEFSAKIRDVLNFDDDIFPITSYEEEENKEVEDEIKLGVAASASSFAINEDLNSKKTILSKVEDRLKSVMNNSVSLQFFNEFCLQEYAIENVLFWVEAQVYSSIADPSLQTIFSKHLYHTYIKPGAPLALNVDEEMRRSITSSYESPNAETYVDIQAFIYILIKQHAYNRYENSQIFKRFLKFKEEGTLRIKLDRYAYVQGKTTWNFENTIVLHQLIEIKNFLSLAENTDSEESQKELKNFGGDINSTLFRQHILLRTISRYFPKTAVTKGYFESENRAEWGTRHRQIQKQKRLQKFFGDRPTNDLMDQQGHILEKNESFEDTNSIDGVKIQPASITENAAASEGSLEFDKRKKAEKLAGFFGGNLPNRQMKRQNLLGDGSEDKDNRADVESVYSIENPGLMVDDEMILLGTVNTLTAEEKMILTRRAKKLLGVLGAEVDSNIVSMTQGKHVSVMPTKSVAFASELSNPLDDNSSPSSNYNSPAVSGNASIDEIQISRNAQKQKLDKISYVMGERISEDVIQKIAEDPPMVQARPLTLQEKKLFLKKNNKLEGFFGNSVPAETVINYTGNEKEDAEDIDSNRSSAPLSPTEDNEEAERQNQILRLRKLRKMLGIHDENGPPITEDDIKKIEDSIIRSVTNESDRISLLEDLNKMKKRVTIKKLTVDNPNSPIFARMAFGKSQ